MRISDWSSDVCSSDLTRLYRRLFPHCLIDPARIEHCGQNIDLCPAQKIMRHCRVSAIGTVQAMHGGQSLHRRDNDRYARTPPVMAIASRKAADPQTHSGAAMHTPRHNTTPHMTQGD